MRNDPASGRLTRSGALARRTGRAYQFACRRAAMASEILVQLARLMQFLFLWRLRTEAQRKDEKCGAEQKDNPIGSERWRKERSHAYDQSRSKSRSGFSMGPSFAFLRPSANFRASTSSFVFSASTDARNFASTASSWARNSRAVSSRSTEGGGFGGGTCESTTPSWRSSVSFAWQHGQATSNIPAEFFDMRPFYAKLDLTRAG